MKPTIVRYYKNGWHHAQLLNAGRKWAVVRDLDLRQRRHRVPLTDVREALWQYPSQVAQNKPKKTLDIAISL